MSRKKKYATLRFGVGSPESRMSAIWRIWAEDASTGRATKSDVYIAARSIAGVMKATLHESGEWHFGFTSQYATKFVPNGVRHWDTWQRPPEFASGMTLAFHIYVPESELTVFEHRDARRPDVTWVHGPRSGHMVDVSILLGPRPFGPGMWPGKATMDTELLLAVRLLSGEFLWVVWNHVRLTEQQLVDLKLNKKKARIRAPSHVDLDRPSIRVVLCGQNHDESRFFIDAAV